MLPLFVLAAVCFGAYANTLHNGFVYDDNAIVAMNPLVKSLGNLPTIFTTNYWGARNADSGLYRPVTVASFCIDHALWGLNASAFHAVNILWHALAAILAYLFLFRVLGRRRVAFLAALVFAIHPLHVEAVSGIVGRAEILSTCFALGAALSHLRYRAGGRARFLALAATLYFFALLSKETAILLPLLLIALDAGLTLPGAAGPYSRGQPRWLRAYLAYGVAVAAVFAVRFLVLGPHQLTGPAAVSVMDNPLYELPPLLRLAGAFYVLVRYLLLMVFPLRLSPDYSYDQIPAITGITDPRGWLALAAFGLFLWLFIRFTRRHDALFLALCLFWVPFFPVSNVLVPIGTIMAERLAYLPLLGFALALALALDTALAGSRRRPAALVAAVLILAALTARTATRNRDWRDDPTLFSAALEVVPRSSRVRLFLGRHCITAGEYEKGIDHLTRSLEIFPGNPEAMAEIGQGHIGRGELEEAEARFLEAIQYDPDHVDAYYGLGRIYRQRGAYQRALKELQRCVDLVPLHMDARADMGAVHYALEDYAEARRTFEAILALDPSSVVSEYYLGLIDRADGEPGAWRERYERVARTAKPQDVAGHNYLALIHEELGDLPKAYANLVLARSLNPRSSLTGANLARHYALRGALPQAIGEAATVLKTNPSSVEALQVLGFANILRGRHAEAESLLFRAESQRPTDHNTALHLARLGLARNRAWEAKRWLDRAYQLRPRDPSVLLFAAAFERSRGDWGAARDFLRQARTVHPQPVLVELELARIEAASGDSAAALRRLRSVDRRPLGPEMDYRLGLAYAETGHPEEAAQVMGRALAAQPRDGRFLYEQALILMRLNRHAQAESLLTALVEQQRDHGDGLNALGWLILEKPDSGDADFHRALSLTEEAIRADSLRAQYHDTRAEALFRLGRNQEARAAWARAAELAPHDPDYAGKSHER